MTPRPYSIGPGIGIRWCIGVIETLRIPLICLLIPLSATLGAGQRGSQPFKEMFRALGADSDEQHGYFSVRREERQLSDTAQRSGTRTSYIGSEVFISLSDPKQPPFDQEIEALSLNLSCTNRDLPLLLRAGDKIDFRFSEFMPTQGLSLLRDPSKPRPALARGAYASVSYTHLTLPTILRSCRSRWSPYH